MPYKITILRQPKEETAILYNLYLKTLYNNSSVLSIYTDGSQTEKGLGIGLGLAVYSHETPYIPVVAKHRESRNIGASAIVYNGELEGVTRAIEYASSIAKRGELFNIYTDNQAGLLRLKTPSDKPGQSQQIRAILATKALKAKGANIELIWVPGHTDIVGNKEADKLAKTATTISNPESVKTSFAFLGVQINKVKKQEYRVLLESYTKPKTQLESYSNIYPWKVSKKINLPLGILRPLASAFFQLKLGHGYIKSYLYRLNIVSNNKCKCGQTENAKHLLLYCTLYKEERARLFSQFKGSLIASAFNLRVLLHTEIGISNVLVFLKETSICTRKWHIERNIEVEEEEEVGVDLGEELGAE